MRSLWRVYACGLGANEEIGQRAGIGSGSVQKSEQKSKMSGAAAPDTPAQSDYGMLRMQLTIGAEPSLTLAVPKVPPRKDHLLGKARPLPLAVR
jgi:hypothetical protein